MARPLPSAISAQGLERIVDSDESLTSDMDLSKPSSDIDVGVGATGSSKASSDIGCHRHVPVRPPISEEPHADAKDPVEPARVVKRGKLVHQLGSTDDDDECSESAFRGDRFIKPLKVRSSCRERSKVESGRGVQKSNSVAVRVTGQSKSQDGFECRKGSVRQSKKILVKIPTITNLNLTIEPECGILESRFSPTKSHAGNYLCEERCRFRRHLSHSMSFQSSDARMTKDMRRIGDYERPSNLTSSRSFCSGKLKPRYSSRLENMRPPKLGDLSLIRCHEAITSSQDLDSLEFDDSLDENLSPPPLSNLHIFAISTKPEDIQLAPMDGSIPGDIDKLPSLPIIDHSERRLNGEKKLSILEPPPPGLVSREESNENWNRFLLQLNSILESRAGEFV